MPMRPLPKELIKYHGICDLDGLFRMIAAWLKDRGYEVEEKKVKSKVPSPAGGEQEIEWSAWLRETDYLKNWIHLHYWLYEMKDVDVVKDGVKRKLTRIRLQIEIATEVETDWQKRWESSTFLKHLRDFYERHIIRKDLETIWEDKLYYIVLKLHAAIKEYLDMENKANPYHDVW
ncbi:MAG TPA: hypothetical protein VJC16_05500 [Candidatus Nanoarchaeia archaeon]|nr:hypothetical protein [Candidatus Nanoarchaeia archaeon]